MQLTQSISRNAQIHHGQTATICGSRRQTWSQLRLRISRLAGGMRALGVARADRIAILSLNSDRYLEVCFAAWWLGAVVVPMNVRWSASEHAYSMNDAGATMVLVDENFAAMMPDILRDTVQVPIVVQLADDQPDPGMHAYEDLILLGNEVPDVAAKGEELAGIFYTGGTTGKPKGVMLPHRALWSSGMAFACHARLDEDVRCLHAAPMFHIADFMSAMACTIVGATQVFIPAFSARAVINIVAREKVSFTLLVPVMINMLLEEIASGPISDLSCLKQVAFGASPMPRALLQNAIAILPWIKWSQAYGQTELAPLICFQEPEYCTLEGPNAEKLTSVGRPVWCSELRLVDQHGQDVGVDQIGEVLVRGPNAMLGYWNKPDETAATLIDGWVHTGDAATIDKDGFVFIKDRLKDMIITGGENVFSAEVESALSLHPAVRECAVVGVPDERWGESVLAIVVTHAGQSVDERELVEHCRARIAHYKCPRRIEFRTNALPTSGAGKVLKRVLRAPYWSGRERQIQ